MKFGRKAKLLIFIDLSLALLDRLTKWFILKNPNFYFGRIVELKLFKNLDLYFIPLNSTLLCFCIGALILLLLFFFLKTKDVFLRAGFSLIILGGSSNLFDRLFFGYVIDWIRIFILPISIFNIADLMIFSGLLCLILGLIKSK